MANRRVVISGLGLVSALGHDAEQVLAAFQSDFSPFIHSPELPGAVCAPSSLLPQNCPEGRFIAAWRHRRYLNRGARLAVEAALRAVSSSAFTLPSPKTLNKEKNAAGQILPAHTSLVCAAGPMLDLEKEFGERRQAKDALWLLRMLPNTAASALAILLNLSGQSLTIGTACAAGLQAIGEAFRQVGQGLCDRALVSAGDSRLSRTGLEAYANAKALCTHLDPDDPSAPSRAAGPFDLERKGFVAGEGGASFILEPLQSARTHKSKVWAEILGFAANTDGFSLTAPDPQAKSARQCIQQAVEQSGISAGDIDWICAHGTGTWANDEAEALALREVFGSRPSSPPIMALKSWVGHCASACGAVELALALIACGNNLLPKIKNLRRPNSPEMNFNLVNSECPGPVGLVQSFGFGGQNAALVLKLVHE